MGENTLAVHPRFVGIIKERKDAKGASTLSYDDILLMINNDGLLLNKYTQGYFTAKLEGEWGNIWSDRERDEEIISFAKNFIKQD